LKRLEEIVKTYPANKLDLLNANTKFTIKSEGRKGALTIRALSLPPSTSEFENIMDFNTGQLTYWQSLKKICRYRYYQQNYDKILGNFRQLDKSLLLFFVLGLDMPSLRNVLGSMFNAPAIFVIPKYDLLNANTKFTIKSEGRKGALTIRALSLPPSTSEFENIMDFN
jgi:hypothetical protein